MIPVRKQTLLTTSSSAVQFHIKMSLLWKPPVWLHRNLCLPQHSKSVPPLQTRDHKRVCWGVEFAGKQRRRLNDPRQVSWTIYTALPDITACKKKPQDLAAFVPLSVSIHIKKSDPLLLKSSGRRLRSPGVQITWFPRLLGWAFMLDFEFTMEGKFSFFLSVLSKILHDYFRWLRWNFS